MKLSAILAIALWLPVVAAGQSLYQAEHTFEQQDARSSYEQFLGRTVFQGYAADADLSFYVMPSFKGQYGAWMTKTKEGYGVVTTRARRDLWSVTDRWDNLTAEHAAALARQVNDAKLIETSRRELDRVAGERVLREWQRLLVESRLGERPMGADGATAVFRSFFGRRGQISRDAWSPKVGTPARKLWEIGDALCAFARGENQELIEKALLLPSKELPEKTGTLDN